MSSRMTGELRVERGVQLNILYANLEQLNMLRMATSESASHGSATRIMIAILMTVGTMQKDLASIQRVGVSPTSSDPSRNDHGNRIHRA